MLQDSQCHDLIETAHRRYHALSLPPGHIAAIPDSGGCVIGPAEIPQPGDIDGTFVVLSKIDPVTSFVDLLAAYRADGVGLMRATDEEFAAA
jgi:hypothetical protein